MLKRYISAALAVALVLCVCLPTAVAASVSARAVGSAVADGRYTLPLRSEGTGTDLEHDYYYSESFFDHASTQYDHQLATASLGLALAAFDTAASDSQYWVDGDVGREAGIAAAYKTLGFSNAKFYNYDVSLNTYKDYSAYSLAQKTYTQNGRTRTIIALVLRGGGYGSEWASNVRLGAGALHTGFAGAVGEVFDSLSEYISAAAARGALGEIKLWVTGYSRGGAVANLLAAKINSNLPAVKRENVYVYTFAAPAVMTAAADSQYKLDYDANHTSDGELKDTWSESNVFNIIGSGDIVPQVPPENWGYHRNGCDRYLPLPQTDAEAVELNAIVKSVNPDSSLDFSGMAGSRDVGAIITSLEDVFQDKATYYAMYQSAMMDMLQCAFQRSEDEVVLGVVLGNEAIFQRLHSLSNMEQFSWGNIVGSVWLASATSRPLLERFGSNVPLRVQQMIIPLLATGLCYNIEQNALQVLVRVITDMVAAESNFGQTVNAYKSHYPEAYLALMEYYSPETHAMQAYSR